MQFVKGVALCNDESWYEHKVITNASAGLAVGHDVFKEETQSTVSVLTLYQKTALCLKRLLVES